MKILLVEGVTEKRVIPELIEANGIQWEQNKQRIVEIIECGGYEKILSENKIKKALKNKGLTHLGIIIDADNEPENRWESIRNACLQIIPNLPEELPKTGLIYHSYVEAIAANIIFVILMMPDNYTRGIKTTFLAYLLPDNNEKLWEYAQEVVTEAKNKGALFTEFHRDKANIYTWLAWQNEPGKQLHEAVKYKIFQPQHPRGKEFVTWFKALYNLTKNNT